MLFYLFVFFICFLLAYIADGIKGKASAVFVMCVVFILSVIGGMRDMGIGTDTLVYSMSYFNVAKHLTSWTEFVESRQEKGYMLLNYIAVHLSNKVWIAHFVVQLFTNGLILFAAYNLKRSFRFRLSLFTLAYCCIFYNQTYNFMRQYCALALLLVGLYFILKKQWKLYLVCQLCAFFFHSTSLLFVFVPALYYTCMVGYKHKWHYFIVGGSIIMVFVTSTYYYEVLDLLNTMGIVSDMYADRYGIYSEFEARNGLRKSLVLLIVYVFYLIYIAYKRGIVERSFTFFLLSINLFFIAFYSLSFYSMYLYRMALYFYLPMMLFTSFIVSSRKILSLERIGFVVILLLDWYLYIVIGNGAESFPYQSKILGI